MKKIAVALMLATLAAGCAHMPKFQKNPNYPEALEQQQQRDDRRAAQDEADKKCGVVGSHQIEGTRGTARGDYDCKVGK